MRSDPIRRHRSAGETASPHGIPATIHMKDTMISHPKAPRRTLASATARRLAAMALLIGTLPAAAIAQGPTPTVAWTASASTQTAKPGARLALVLHGTVRDGWHVYALKQLESGPTPLRVTLDPQDIATAAGAPLGSTPIVAHDAAFGLDTPYYTRGFTVTVPLRLKPHAAAGRQSIPVSVRFQTCNGQTCEPPKTLHLSAAIDVQAGR